MFKKGLMAIGSIIIFIAVVIISAIAAGFLIRSTNLLQQRAVSVSDEARERIVTGIDILNIVGESDLENETLNDFEMLVRLKPGSYPLQIKDLNIMFTTPTYTESAILQNPEMPKLFDDIDISSVPNSTNSSSWMTIPNIEVDNDYDLGDNSEKVRLLIDNSSGGYEKLQFNLSYASNNPDPELKDLGYDVPGSIFDVNLNIDLGNAVGQTIDLRNLPIKNPDTNDVYGYVSISGSLTHNNSLEGLTAIVTSNPTENKCSFDTLTPNKRFCYITRVGKNSNTKLEKGELMTLRFKVKKQQAIGVEESINFKLIPKGGSIEGVSLVTPSVLELKTTNLWG